MEMESRSKEIKVVRSLKKIPSSMEKAIAKVVSFVMTRRCFKTMTQGLEIFSPGA